MQEFKIKNIKNLQKCKIKLDTHFCEWYYNIKTSINARNEVKTMSTNMNALRGKMVEKRISSEEMAHRIGVDASTFYRKMKSDGMSFTVGQMHKIAEVLNLTHDEAASIFLW